MCVFSVSSLVTTYSGTGSPLHRQTIFKPLDHRRRFSPSRHAAQVVGLSRIQQHLRTPIDHRVIWWDWNGRGECEKHTTSHRTFNRHVLRQTNILRTVSLALLDLRAASGAWHSYRESSDRSADRISRLYWPNSCTRNTRYLGQAGTHTGTHSR